MAKILLVDDDLDLLESSKMILESGGHQVTTASTTQEAERLINSGKYDLIPLDIMMEFPDDGINLAHKLRKNGVQSPIVMLSAVSRVTGYQYGKCDEVLPCNDFLEKPMTPKVLLDKVNAILNK
jgi:DNA-binding response OmpR family regulator